MIVAALASPIMAKDKQKRGRFGLRQVEYLANRALNRPIVRLLFGKSPAAVGKDLQPK
jgi:hypothetical protein